MLAVFVRSFLIDLDSVVLDRFRKEVIMKPLKIVALVVFVGLAGCDGNSGTASTTTTTTPTTQGNMWDRCMLHGEMSACNEIRRSL